MWYVNEAAKCIYHDQDIVAICNVHPYRIFYNEYFTIPLFEIKPNCILCAKCEELYHSRHGALHQEDILRQLQPFYQEIKDIYQVTYNYERFLAFKTFIISQFNMIEENLNKLNQEAQIIQKYEWLLDNRQNHEFWPTASELYMTRHKTKTKFEELQFLIQSDIFDIKNSIDQFCDKQNHFTEKKLPRTAGIYSDWNNISLERIIRSDQDISCLCSSPNSKFIACASSFPKNRIQVYEIRTGDQYGCDLIGHVTEIKYLHFLSDIKLLSTSTLDQMFKLWNIETSQEIRSLFIHQTNTYQISLSGNNHFAINNTYENTIAIWNSNLLDPPLINKKLNSIQILNIRFSPNGRYLAMRSLFKLYLWNIRTKKFIHQTPISYSTAFEFSQNSKYIIFKNSPYKIWMIEIRSMRHIFNLEQDEQSQNMIALSQDQKFIADSHKTGIRIWNIMTRSSSMLQEEERYKHLKYTQDGKKLLSVAKKKIRVYDTSNQI